MDKTDTGRWVIEFKDRNVVKWRVAAGLTPNASGEVSGGFEAQARNGAYSPPRTDPAKGCLMSERALMRDLEQAFHGFAPVGLHRGCSEATEASLGSIHHFGHEFSDARIACGDDLRSRPSGVLRPGSRARSIKWRSITPKVPE
jgi:hypothetical protein